MVYELETRKNKNYHTNCRLKSWDKSNTSSDATPLAKAVPEAKAGSTAVGRAVAVGVVSIGRGGNASALALELTSGRFLDSGSGGTGYVSKDLGSVSSRAVPFVSKSSDTVGRPRTSPAQRFTSSAVFKGKLSQWAIVPVFLASIRPAASVVVAVAAVLKTSVLLLGSCLKASCRAVSSDTWRSCRSTASVTARRCSSASM